MSGQGIPASPHLIHRWAAPCKVPVSQNACTRRIHNVIVLASSSDSLLGTNSLLVFSKQTTNTVLDEFNVSLVLDNHVKSLRSEFWKPVMVVGNRLGFGYHVSPSSYDSSPMLWIIISAAGGRKPCRGRSLRPPCIGAGTSVVPSAYWP